MDLNFVLLLCIALIFAAKVNGESQVVSKSNLTGASDVTNATTKIIIIDHSTKNTTDDNKQLNDGSNKKTSDSIDTSKSEIKIVSNDESEVESVTSNSSRKKKEVFHGEECDPSNMCTDNQDQFVACLRVPGNDAPHLSLLIQNKGKSNLVVTITAPSFVGLEKKKVQLLENENTKVKVSIKKGGAKDSAIVLNGNCRLELKDLAAGHETGKDDTVSVSRPLVLNMSPRTLVISMISFVVLFLVIVPVIIHVCRRKNKSWGNNKYQKLDMELPVSIPSLVSKNDEETGGGDDGWNNNWGDDWDDGDEEQPNTPVLPVTPSVSSRGLASRRLNKDGWKD